jgi:hypothetical protein
MPLFYTSALQMSRGEDFGPARQLLRFSHHVRRWATPNATTCLRQGGTDAQVGIDLLEKE